MDTNGGIGTAPAAVRKTKSPKAPGISLRTAIAEVGKVYQRYSHAEFTRSEMANALGMSGTSGAFAAKAATLKEYGLIDESGSKPKVSELFMAIYAAPPGSTELKRHALQAVRNSAMFSRLLGQFSTKVPDEAALALRLETQERFNRDRAREVASAFRSSLSEYGLIDGIGNLLPVRNEPSQTKGPDNEESEDLGAASAKLPTGVGVFRVEVPLGAGRKAVLALPEDLGEADKNKICAVLGAYATA
jgi:hypothetical protein